MNWNSIYQKIFSRVNRSDQKIVDGVLLSETDASELSELDTVKQPDQTDETQSDQLDTVKQPVFYPITIPQYPASYLVDDIPNGDLGLFYHWLESNRYKAFRAYISDMEVWRKHLRGYLDTSEIVRVIAEYLPDRLTRAKRMMYSLKVYGQYRYDFGDPRISLILAVDERKLKLPNPKRKKFDVALSPGAIEMLNNQAKTFCTENDRAGIWLGLLLRGVPASAVKTVEIIGRHQIRFKNWTKLVELRVQEWLIINMLRMPEDKWRINRVTIQKRIREYADPMTLYKNASISLSVLGE